jgi:hypothetical protein
MEKAGVDDGDKIENVRSLGARLRNWGCWGGYDERGTTNLITPEKLIQSAKLIKKGLGKSCKKSMGYTCFLAVLVE